MLGDRFLEDAIREGYPIVATTLAGMSPASDRDTPTWRDRDYNHRYWDGPNQRWERLRARSDCTRPRSESP